MSFDAPHLAGSTGSNPAEISVQSQNLLEFNTGESDEIPASARVAIIVGEDEESPDVEGERARAGRFDPDQEDYVKTPNLTLHLDSKALLPYVGKTVNVRTKVYAESGQWVSESLRLHVKA